MYANEYTNKLIVIKLRDSFFPDQTMIIIFSISMYSSKPLASAIHENQAFLKTEEQTFNLKSVIH